MEGGALQVTRQVLFLATFALIPVLAEATSFPPSSPLDTRSVAGGMVDRMGPSATAVNGEHCNRRYAAKHLSNRCQKSFYHMFTDVSDRKLAVQHGRDLITMSSEQKTMSNASLRAEVEALIAFKDGVTRDSLGALSSWSSNDLSACQWKGVTCDLPSKRVIALELGNLELVGSISPLLGRLQYLQNLDLSGNIFNGEIPVSLLNCSSSSHLALRDNNLTGQIPSQLGHLLNLRYLDVSGNFILGGTFPASLGNCSQLQFFFLNFTNIKGAIPNTVGQLTHLEILNVSATALSGAIPRSLGNCSSLTRLAMGYIYYLPGGDFQDTIRTTGLSGDLPMEMGSLTRLTYLSILGSDIGGHFPGWIANLTRLKYLALADSSFRGEILDVFGKLPLEYFNVEWNNFTGAFPTTLLNCSDLFLVCGTIFFSERYPHP